MKTKILLTIAALLAGITVPADSQELGLVFPTANDLRQTAAETPVPAPQADLGAMDEAQLSSYLADREAVAETADKSSREEPAPVNLGGDGALKLRNQWTGENLEVRYRDANGRYIPEALARIKHFMRCSLTGKEMTVPAKLVELLDIIQEKAGGGTITVICGYRSPELNGALAANSDAVAKKSLHMKGWAADIKIEGVRTSVLRDIAASLKAGGVGYYPSDGFVHVDIGLVRYW
jgi:uncharacterized protein YcbK (DUF882 family)